MIPEHCSSLWKQLIEADKGVRVHEQELTKATDIKTLFDLGLIRVVRDTALHPAVDLVLSQLGEEIKSNEAEVPADPISKKRSPI